MTTPRPYEPSPRLGTYAAAASRNRGAQTAPTLGGYSTAPPWATPHPAPESPAPPPPPPYRPYRRLMVPHPEEMFYATRPEPPSWVPVAVLTLCFGVFGAISAARRAAEAKRGVNDVRPYWIAFGAALAAGTALSVMALAVAVPAYLQFREEAVTKAVASGVARSNGKTATAVCEPLGERAANGVRRYSCLVTTATGGTTEITVKADSDGLWTQSK